MNWSAAARESGLWRFLKAGTADGVARLARVVRVEPPDDRAVAAACASSAIFGGIDRFVALLHRAWSDSRTARILDPCHRSWEARPIAARNRSIGIALLAASATDAALASWRRPAAGWLWLVVPALAAAFGLLMALAPDRGLREDGHQ
jgi:hypothetical protein